MVKFCHIDMVIWKLCFFRFMGNQKSEQCLELANLFFNIKKLTMDSVISDKLSELELAQVKRDILRQLKHYPFQKKQWRWAR